MAIESAAYFRRLVRTGFAVFIGLFCLCGAALAQKELVTASSVIPLQHSTGWCQIYKIINAPNGDTLFLDVCGGGGYGSIYRLKQGSSTFDTVTPSIDTGGTYWNEDMAMDAKGTLYITDRYGSQHLYRVPYNPADDNWDFSASGDNWEPSIDTGFEKNGTQNVAWLDSSKKDGSGLLFVSEQNANNILVIPVNADGTVPNFPSGPDAGQPEFQYLIKGLLDKVQPMAVDQNGNLYFIENPYDSPAARVTGVFFIPASAYQSCMAASAAGSTDPTQPCISGNESALSRIDPNNPEKFNGITLDAAGNAYVADASDGYGGTRNGILMIPNESGSPVGVTAASFNFEDAEYLSVAPANSNPDIDPRGFIWIPTGGSGNWSPSGSGAIPGTGNLILWQLGAANLGATPVGTPATPGVVFYTFSGSVTPSSLTFSQPGGGTDFSASATNPYPPTSGTTPATPCAAGTAYIDFDSCQYWVGFDPQGANSVGSVQGQLSMLDASSKVISGSTVYLSGTGEGPEVALLVPANQTPISTGLVTPEQVAGDSLGNSYVADPGQGKVLMFPAGSTTASAGTSVGSGLTKPTGVAVDGNGDIYIADSGKVLEVPAVNGKPSTSAPTTLQSGFGANAQLATDGAGNVYVADPGNKRVVRLYNPQMSLFIQGTDTIGSFTTPTAIATDDAGDVFVADGSSLDEVNAWGGQSTITNSLAAPVTGLAVDPSGSVYVAQSTGVIRIPLETGGLNANDAAGIDTDGIPAASGLGMDALGNLYVAVSSYNNSTLGASGAGTSAVASPSLLLLNGAFVNFGLVSQFTESDPIDVNVYNIGNAPLALTGAPTFGGTDPGDYEIEQDGQNPCDTSGSTTVASATACQLGVTITAQGLGVSQGTMAVTTNAPNAPSSNAVLEGYSSDLLCRTLTTITLNPATGLLYPGATTVSSSTVPDPAAPCAAGGVPQGGNIVLTLQPQAKGASQSTQTQQLAASGNATFTLTGLNGGTYSLFVSYKGDSVYGGSSSLRTFTIQVAQAMPTVTLATPNGVTAINGIYYVQQGVTTTMQASVTSTLGSPTGSVSIMNGSNPADPTQNPITLDANGNATFNTANLAAGPGPSQLGQVYNLSALYNSDINFASVQSSPSLTVEVVPPSALISADPGSISTKAGTPVTTTLTITPLEGYSPKENVELYCDSSTLPKYSECTFDVPQVDIFDHPGVPQISHMTISSNLAISLSERRTDPSTITFASLFGLGLLGLAFRKKGKLTRSKLTIICLLLVFAGSVVGFTGCTNSGYTHTPPPIVNSTPPGTYNVRIYTIDLQTDQQSSLPFTLPVTIQ